MASIANVFLQSTELAQEDLLMKEIEKEELEGFLKNDSEQM
jgi:hypothetical protein